MHAQAVVIGPMDGIRSDTLGYLGDRVGCETSKDPGSASAGLTAGTAAFYLRGPVSAASPAEPARTPPLSAEQAGEVLRYWLASLQQEEALSQRPRARRAVGATPQPRVDTPSAGHDYFKLGFDDALHALLSKRAPLHKPLDAELGAFFETWLAGQYRRGDQDRELAHVLAFPVVHLPRGELAGLLRCGVRVQFGDPSGPPFRVPTRGARRRKQYPAPPREVRLSLNERGAQNQKWPFFVDTRLLHQQLGVTRERIDALFDTLRADRALDERRMLAHLCELLAQEACAVDPGAPAAKAPTADSSATLPQLLQRATLAMARLLTQRAGRARVYPVGIVLDATRARTTYHLQRELQALLDEDPDIALDPASTLGAYLTASPQPPGLAVQRTLFPRLAISPSQRRAAERCLGSKLSAVQGPPGTGKTTLILHLATEAVTRKVERLLDHGVMGDSLFVVTSTNNRAVDNVIDPMLALSADDLPLALRAGSQRVCEQLLSTQLAQALAWLQRERSRPAAEREAALAAALDSFRYARDALADALAPRARALRQKTQRERLLAELERLKAAQGKAKRVRALERQLEAVPADVPAADSAAPTDRSLPDALLSAALDARKAWAAAHSDALCPSLELALTAVRNESSLRSLFTGEPEAWTRLRQLFGVWGCTLLSLGNCLPAQRDVVDHLVIDEAGQCHPAYAVSGLLRSRAASIVGDVNQLRPVIDVERDADARLIETCKLALDAPALEPYRVYSESDASVQALADRAVIERPILTDHFRCQPEIIAICDALCSYGLQVHTARRGPAAPLPFLPHPVSLLDIAGDQERLGGSWHNAAERASTVELLQLVLAAGIDPADVAIITPYRGQLELLRKQLLQLGVPLDHSIELLDLDEPHVGVSQGVALGTVHRFQGGERSVVLFSSVVSRRASLPFLNERANLLNVAISRARHRFVALGNRALLATGERTRLLVHACETLAPDALFAG